MKPNRVPDDLIKAGFDAIRDWHAANPGPNSYLDDRTRMRIVLAAVLTLHNQQVEQPLRERAETAERELAEMRERIGEAREEWAIRTAAGAEAFCATRNGALRIAAEWTSIRPDGPWRAESRVVGEWKAADSA